MSKAFTKEDYTVDDTPVVPRPTLGAVVRLTRDAVNRLRSEAATHGLTPNQMGLMVEAQLMQAHGFSTSTTSLMNAINSPGRNMLAAATPAQRAAVVAEANALHASHNASIGKIC